MKRWQKITIAAAAAGIVAGGIGFAEYRNVRRQNVAWAQAGYDTGFKVGRVIGQCDALKSVAKANPGSVWARHAKPALDACEPFLREHGPGTSEIIQKAPGPPPKGVTFG